MLAHKPGYFHSLLRLNFAYNFVFLLEFYNLCKDFSISNLPNTIMILGDYVSKIKGSHEDLNKRYFTYKA